MNIRKAKLKDLEELLAIYNYEVENGVATLDLHPKTLKEWRRWFDAHNINNHPLYVAEEDGHIAGYASLSPYREKEAYKTTVELSIYIGKDYRQKGIATALMAIILEIAKLDQTIHTVVSVITSGNEASTKLHKRYGFTYCGTIHEVGYKMGAYQDIDNFELKVGGVIETNEPTVDLLPIGRKKNPTEKNPAIKSKDVANAPISDANVCENKTIFKKNAIAKEIALEEETTTETLDIENQVIFTDSEEGNTLVESLIENDQTIEDEQKKIGNTIEDESEENNIEKSENEKED